jgi:hypothetical protein
MNTVPTLFQSLPVVVLSKAGPNGNNRSRKNLEEIPLTVLFCVTESPLGFQTPGVRLYVKLREIQKAGALYAAVKTVVAEHAGADAAKMIVASAAFEVTDNCKTGYWQPPVDYPSPSVLSEMKRQD